MTVSGHVGPRWLIGRDQRGEPAAEWGPSLDGVGARGALPPRYRPSYRGQAPAQPADDGKCAGLPPRAPLRRTHPSRRANHRCLGRRRLGHVADGTDRRFSRLVAGADRDRALAQLPPLGAAGRHGGAALGLHRGRLGHAALDRIRGATGSPLPIDGSPRSDITRSLRVFAHNRALTLEGFSPQVSVVQEQRTSTAQLHDYERIFGELRFVRLF